MNTATNEKSKIQVSDPFADVRLSPVNVNGSTVENQAVEILDDDGEWQALAIHSGHYQLIPNRDVADAAGRILEQSDHTWRLIRRIWTGKFLSNLYCSNLQVEVPDVHDAIALGLRIENSYDGSCKCRMVLMAYVLSCLNGMMSNRCFNSYSLKHIHSHAFDGEVAIGVINNGLSVLDEITPRIRNLSSKPLEVFDLANIAKSIDMPGSDWKHIMPQLDQAKSLWDLLQMITHRLSHHGRGKAQIQRNELVGDYFLDHLAMA